MDLTTHLKPLVEALRQHREGMGRTAREVSADAGYTSNWVTEMESGKGCINPTVQRLATWSVAVGAQEFGVYVVIDGHHTAVPVHSEIYDEDDDYPDSNLDGSD